MKKTNLLLATLTMSMMLCSTALAGTWHQQEDGQWRYQNDDGNFATGWIEDGGKSYYLNEDGIMLANTTTPDGQQVGADGALVQAPLFEYATDRCYVKYTGHEISTDYEGNPCLIVYYDYTNKADEALSAMANDCYINAYQNGVECDRATISYGNNNKSIENHYKKIMPGITINVAEAFKISDKSDVTLTLDNIFDFSGKSKTVSTVLKLQ